MKYSTYKTDTLQTWLYVPVNWSKIFIVSSFEAVAITFVEPDDVETPNPLPADAGKNIQAVVSCVCPVYSCTNAVFRRSQS